MRKCPRRGDRELGWQCCLKMRIDLKCPLACPYAARHEANNPIPAFRSDSNTELWRTLSRYLDFWIHQPLPALNGLSPAELAGQDKNRLLAWLGTYQYPANFPIARLLEKLGVEHTPVEEPQSPETIALAWLDRFLAQDWTALRAFTSNTLNWLDLEERYARLLSSSKELQKMNSREILHAGLAEDGVSAMVVLEINHKRIWSILLSSRDERGWKLRQNFCGSPDLYYKQNDLFRLLAEHLAQAEDVAAWQLLTDKMPFYPDCADLYYYRSFYWQLAKQLDKAKEDLMNALALDNGFFSAGTALASLLVNERELTTARDLYLILRTQRPDDLNVQNNLAACEAGLGNLDEALSIWGELARKAPAYEPAQKNLAKYRA